MNTEIKRGHALAFILQRSRTSMIADAMRFAGMSHDETNEFLRYYGIADRKADTEKRPKI